MLNEKIISGIQQIGIGVSNVHEAWNWYREHFGMDIKIFEESAVAELMYSYTGGKPRKRHAALTMNLQGGGGFEIWQYVDRIPDAPANEIQAGDLGIYITKIKTRNVRAAYETFQEEKPESWMEYRWDPTVKSISLLKILIIIFSRLLKELRGLSRNVKNQPALLSVLLSVFQTSKMPVKFIPGYLATTR